MQYLSKNIIKIILLNILVGISLNGTLHAATNYESTPDSGELYFDYPVSAIVFDSEGNTYIGGEFTYIGTEFTGSGAEVDLTTGLVTSTDPEITGGDYTVQKIISDNAGGWYIAGEFTSIGGLARSYLAHILPDNSVDTNFNPNPNGIVYSLLLSGSTLYVGGNFTTIGGQSRNRLATLNAATGTATTWNPNLNGTPNDMELSGTTLYIAGSFTTIGGTTRNRLASFNTTTWTLNAWNPNVNGLVRAIELNGSTIYLGGDFSTVGGSTRTRIASVDASTGTVSSWNPVANNIIRDFATYGNTLYVCGKFTSIGGSTRYRIASFDIPTGVVTSWDPSASNEVQVLRLDGETLYTTGDFTKIGNKARSFTASFDVTTGNILDFNPGFNSAPYAMAIYNSEAFMGGRFISSGGNIRNHLAKFDNTGNLTSWNPNVNSRVESLLLTNDTLYIGGNFSEISNTTRRNLAAIDLTTNDLASWNPVVTYMGGPNTSSVTTMDIQNNTLYIGGYFTDIAGETRTNLAAIDLTTGIPTSWNPNASNTVKTLTIDNDTVYVGGFFTSVDGQPRNYIAALDASTGTATSWDPNASGRVRSIYPDGNTIYVGGDFTTIGGEPRNYIAALDKTTGMATSWNPNADYWVFSIIKPCSTIIAGGIITNIGGQARNGIAELDATTGLATEWNPNLGTPLTPYKIWNSPWDNKIVVGGNFASVAGDDSHRYYATFPATDATPPALSIDAITPDPITDDTPMVTGSVTEEDCTVTAVDYQMDDTSGTWSSCTANDGTFDEATEDYTCGPIASLADGEHTVYIRSSDAMCNFTRSGSEGSDTFTVDTTGPSCEIEINSGDAWTTGEGVSLGLTSIDATTSVTDMMISEDSGFSGASWESYSATRDFTLSAGDGTKTVYVKYQDEVNNESVVCSDEIGLDTTAPVDMSLVSIKGYTQNNTKPTLKLKKGSDGGSSITSYTVRLDWGKDSQYELTGIPANGDGGAKNVWVDDSRVKVTFVHEETSDSGDDEIWVYFKGLDGGGGDNGGDGALSEGKHSWEVIAYDTAGNSTVESTEFYIDKNDGLLDDLRLIKKVGASSRLGGKDNTKVGDSGQTIVKDTFGNGWELVKKDGKDDSLKIFIKDDKTYEINRDEMSFRIRGSAIDPYKGSKSDDNQDEYESVASGPELLKIEFKKYIGDSDGDKSDSEYEGYMVREHTFDDDSIKDENGDEKSATFDMEIPDSIESGKYKVTFKLEDKVGNEYESEPFYIVIPETKTSGSGAVLGTMSGLAKSLVNVSGITGSITKEEKVLAETDEDLTNLDSLRLVKVKVVDKKQAPVKNTKVELIETKPGAPSIATPTPKVMGTPMLNSDTTVTSTNTGVATSTTQITPMVATSVPSYHDSKIDVTPTVNPPSTITSTNTLVSTSTTPTTSTPTPQVTPTIPITPTTPTPTPITRTTPRIGYTDANGEVTFKGIQLGNYTIKVSYKGKTFDQPITIEDTATKEFHYTIEVQESSVMPWYYWLLLVILILLIGLLGYMQFKRNSQRHTTKTITYH